MTLLDKRTTADAVKLVVFIVVTTLATSVLAVTIGNINFGDTKHYKAVFSDVTGLVEGDDIRIAGVKVGNVDAIEIFRKSKALVTFEVDGDVPLYVGTEAAVRYRNLIGQRYISLTRGDGAPAQMSEGGTIPLSHTSPALDLTVLFNGFKPLFEALSPQDVNQLAYEIITVFQGEGGTLESLLAHTASLTSTLANRDRIIGQLIDNLNDVMVILGNRDEELSDLLVQLRRFVSGLAQDRKAILGSLEAVSELSVETASLVDGVRGPFVRDVKELRKVASTLDRHKAEIDRALQVLPIKLNKIGRTAIYGSWFNFYLCNFNGHVTLPGGVRTSIEYNTGAERCDLG